MQQDDFSWQQDGACRDEDPSIFFSVDDFTSPELTPAERTQLNRENDMRARLVCAGCPVRTPCLSHGLQVDRELGAFGTYGGLGPGSRENIRKGKPVRSRFTNGRTDSHPPVGAEKALADFQGGLSLSEAADTHGVGVTTVMKLYQSRVA